jgi:hypothetical protein
MTSEQAELLFDLVKEHRAAIVAKRSPGVCDGLLLTLSQIDRSGGAILQEQSLDYGRNVVGATIVPPSQHLAWLGVATVPEPFECIGTLPHLSYKARFWQPVILCRAKKPLAMVPLPLAALLLPLK